MVIGSDLFTWPSWEGWHEVLPLSWPNRAGCFRVCYILPQWCYRNFELLVSHTNVHAGAGDHGELFWSSFGWGDSHYYAHTEAKYTGIMPVLFILEHTEKFLTRESHPTSQDREKQHIFVCFYILHNCRSKLTWDPQNNIFSTNEILVAVVLWFVVSVFTAKRQATKAGNKKKNIWCLHINKIENTFTSEYIFPNTTKPIKAVIKPDWYRHAKHKMVYNEI